MKVLKKSLLLMLCGCLLICASCAKKEESSSGEAEITPEEYTIFTGADESEEPAAKSALQTPENKTREDGTADIYVTIPTVEVSVADLKANEYVVPVYVSLDQNSGNKSYEKSAAARDCGGLI